MVLRILSLIYVFLNFSTFNFKDGIFLSLFAWLALNFASSSLFLGLVSVVLLFLNIRWKRPFAAMKYYYHEYQTWDKLRIVEGYYDFWISTNFILFFRIILFSFIYCCKNNYIEILFIKYIAYIQWNKASNKDFKTIVCLNSYSPLRLASILSYFRPCSE